MTFDERVRRTADQMHRKHPERTMAACLQLAEVIVEENDADERAVSYE